MLRILATPSTADLLLALWLPPEAVGKVHDLATTFDLSEEPDQSMSADVLESCHRFMELVHEQLGPQIAASLKSLQSDIPSPHEARAATEWAEIMTRLLRDPPANDPLVSEALAAANPIVSRHLAENHRLIQSINARETSITAADWGDYMRSRDFSVAAMILAIAESRQMRAMWRDLDAVLRPDQRARLLELAQSLRPDMATDLRQLVADSAPHGAADDS